MTDQLIIGEKASFDNYMASLATRKIGLPSKKSVKETIPYSNRTYDFSRINGELYWEERELEYVFEMFASTPEELEELKTNFSGWVMNVFEEEIHDPFIPDYHFLGTYEDIDFEDEETLDKTTATVKFMAYPYKIANLPTVFELRKNDYSTNFEYVFENKSSHRGRAWLMLTRDNTLPTGNTVTIRINGSYVTIIHRTLKEVLLPNGVITIDSTYNAPFTIEVTFVEEVF